MDKSIGQSMNIRELAARADFNVTELGIDVFGIYDDIEANLKKFAELIIMQCADHLRDVASDEIANDLLERFEE